jgi:hypothetical protein
MRRLLAVLLSGVAISAAAAASLSPALRAEIDALMSALETSGCEFSRNGNWYSGAEAKLHLLRKLKYLEDKGMVQSTEQFIERAASTSSMTGQPYLVRCRSGAAVQSGAWLSSVLQSIRSAGSVNGAR